MSTELVWNSQFCSFPQVLGLQYGITTPTLYSNTSNLWVCVAPSFQSTAQGTKVLGRAAVGRTWKGALAASCGLFDNGDDWLPKERKTPPYLPLYFETSLSLSNNGHKHVKWRTCSCAPSYPCETIKITGLSLPLTQTSSLTFASRLPSSSPPLPLSRKSLICLCHWRLICIILSFM